MTGKERMRIAMRGGKADCVPVCPDISNMIPCRLTGRSFERIYLYDDPPLGRAYRDAVKYFGFDGWYQYWQPRMTWKSRRGADPEYSKETRPLPEGRYEQVTYARSSRGTLCERYVYYPADPPTQTEKLVKDVAKDLPLLIQWLDADLTEVDWSGGAEDYRAFGDLGIWGIGLGCPGPHHWIWTFDGGLDAVIGTIYDYPDLMEELLAVEHRRVIETTKRYLDAPFTFDFVMIGASGLLTLSSPELYRKFSLPTIREVTRLCRQAGMPTMLHACGKSRYLVETFAAETDLDCFNPLERPPMGDVELAQARRIAGRKLALMGNLLTTDVMLRGTVDDVVRESKKAIDEAGRDGGFILSTGDQCGRDTPDENIVAMVRTAREYGRY